MYIFKLAYRNFCRNIRRSIISGLSIAIAITAIIFAKSYIRGMTDNISNNIVTLISGHIRITTKEYERRERLIPLSEAIDLSPEFYEAIRNEEIVMFSPRIKFGVLLGEEELSIPALGYAIDPEKEIGISGFKKRLVQGSYISTGENATILGKALAERLNVTIGDTLTIITKTAYDSPAGINLLIKGIFKTGIGGMDRSLFYIPLDVGQRLLDLEGRATEFVIIVKDQNNAIDVAREMKSRLDYSVVPFQYNTMLRYINSASIMYSLLYVIILVVASSAIANTMLMVVFERTKEIGMMKAMGLSNLPIISLFTVESAIIGVIGSLGGTLIGAALSYWLKYQGINFAMMSSSTSADMPFGPIIYLSPTPLILIGGFLFGVLATVIVALLPISRVVKLEPAEALRH
ncbi:ABC transporter permease [candidate division WOR-3 bacterium]|nr:ABC transporter permease [candidate division WOR-3 bacterium]